MASKEISPGKNAAGGTPDMVWGKEPAASAKTDS